MPWLAKKAIDENLQPKQIEQAMQNWRDGINRA
jgi:hypothetical protein